MMTYRRGYQNQNDVLTTKCGTKGTTKGAGVRFVGGMPEKKFTPAPLVRDKMRASMHRILMAALLTIAADACMAIEFDKLEAQCAKGVPEACYRIGTYLEYEVRDPVAALQRYSMACDSNYARACTNLGSLYGRGVGATLDSSKAAAFYRKGCDGKDMMACTNLGDFLLRGVGVPADIAAGIALYRQSCEAGDIVACRDLGIVYVIGKSVAADPALGATWLRKACDAGSAQACGDLAYLYHKGTGVPQDSVIARRLYEASCRGGYKQACQMVR